MRQSSWQSLFKKHSNVWTLIEGPDYKASWHIKHLYVILRSVYFLALSAENLACTQNNCFSIQDFTSKAGTSARKSAWKTAKRKQKHNNRIILILIPVLVLEFHRLGYGRLGRGNELLSFLQVLSLCLGRIAAVETFYGLFSIRENHWISSSCYCRSISCTRKPP